MLGYILILLFLILPPSGLHIVGDDMARIFDEQFEETVNGGDGYDEANWAENVTGGDTVDQDADPADVGSPSDWGSECLKIIKLGTDTKTWTYNTFGSAFTGAYWTRHEIVLTSESLSDTDTTQLARFYATGVDVFLTILLRQATGGALQFQVVSYHDGTSNVYTGFPTPTLNTRYRIEIKWDNDNNLWAWRIDGVNQPNDQDNSDPVETEGILSATHLTDLKYITCGSNTGGGKAYTAYYDLVAIDDADWVGAETVPGGVAPTAALYGSLVGPMGGPI